MAAARDLRHLEGFLQALGRGGELDAKATSRALMAHRAATSLARLAAALEGASQ